MTALPNAPSGSDGPPAAGGRRAILRALGTALRGAAWLALGLYAVAVVGLLVLRYHVLPDIDRYRSRIEAHATAIVGRPVTIGAIEAQWQGLRPQLGLREVRVLDADARAGLLLPRIDATLSLAALARGAVRLHLLEIEGLDVTVRRDALGAVSVAGIVLSDPSGEAGVGRWLLAQRGIVLRGAAVTWIDEQRGAPQLWLREVNLRLLRTRGRHQLGLRAHPPDGLAAPIDLRAEWRGSDPAGWMRWDGRAWLNLGDTSLAGWEEWVDLPLGIERGRGSLALWLDFARGSVTAITADLALEELTARLARAEPPLQFEALHGRLAWRRLRDGFEAGASQLALTPVGGPATPPTDARLRWYQPDGGALQRVEVGASEVDLEPWGRLIARLPIGEAAARELSASALRGRVSEVAFTWVPGEGRPGWRVRGRAQNLGFNLPGDRGSLSGLSGSIDGTERAGTLALTGADVGVHLPEVFADALRFDRLRLQGSWTQRGDAVALRIASAEFANGDLAGAVSGDYVLEPAGPGRADLTATLSRVRLPAVATYLPLVMGSDTRIWIAQALQAGRGREVRARLRGELAAFPFGEPETATRGDLSLTARLDGVELDYAQGWPRLTGIEGDIAFRRARMEVNARAASIAGVRLQRVRTVIADLMHHEEIVEASGEAEAPTAEFLRFVAQSPVDALIDGATRGMEAQGRSRLALQLVLPLRRMKDSRVIGSLQLQGNRLQVDRELPALEALSGRLEFSESGIRVNGATLQLLGGPATLSLASQAEGALRVNLAGRVAADGVRRLLPEAIGRALQGSTDWRATLQYRRQLGDMVIESSLAGLAIDLPAPVGKTAAGALPLRVERVSGEQRERLSLSLGTVVGVQVLRGIGQGAAVPPRISLALGRGSAPVPQRAGVSVSGSLPGLDVDAWRARLGTLPGPGRGLAAGDIDLRVGELQVMGRTFHEVALRGSGQAGAWKGTVGSREASGEIAWRPEGRGRLTARMREVSLGAGPGSTTTATDLPVADADLPALDVVVDSLRIAERPLGRLELAAVPEGRDWRIERLRIVNPDGALSMEGLWQGWHTQPRTQVLVRLEFSDAGRLLARLGYAEGVRGGGGRIEGPLSWAGSPRSLDAATLSGQLIVDIGKGQFLKLEPGVARLLGVFNLQNLPRRITLDFRDVFSEGFAFDEIAGSLQIRQGLGVLDGFRIQGGAAQVLMSGEVNFARETQNLRVRVTPALGDGVSLAGALLGGPVAGLATFLLQRALKDPLGQIASFDYAVTGTWADPAVARAPKADPAPGREGG